MRGDPIAGQILLLAGAKASLPASRLPDLVDRVQAELDPRIGEYRRRYELVAETDDAACFFVERGHWREVGDRLGLDGREIDAVRRAHHEQIRRIGRRTDRRAEFDAGFEIREGVVIGR